VSDGAAAIVLSTRRTGGRTDPVRLAGFGHANDFLPAAKRDPLTFAGTAAAWQRALGMAQVDTSDLDLVELHDCFTIAELVVYEAIGLAPRGQGHRLLEDGTVHREGRLPVNVSGGLKAKGHPVGATGVSQHVLAAMQLSGTAGDMQLPAARRAAVHNMGGLAVANYVSVLESV
jgi:acetyl-CoA C-acetyltransferase